MTDPTRRSDHQDGRRDASSRLPSDGAAELGPPPHDELDALLRRWHRTNADRAADGRARLIESLAGESSGAAAVEAPVSLRFTDHARSILMNPITRVAAVFVLLLTLAALILPSATPAYACDVVQLPDGGRLDALDEEGRLLGPCPLQHTDVDVDIAGHFSRVTLRQTYTNPYPDKIEAVYTFPMSHRAAVDRMRMTVGERIVEGEVKEREKARQIYEAARESGYVASLLEQERPNIFTQSVANIEPGATVLVEISYIETLESRDGRYSFAFPMVVGPRYIPGSTAPPPTAMPEGFEPRRGLVLLAPPTCAPGAEGDTTALGSLDPQRLQAVLLAAVPASAPGAGWWEKAQSEEIRRWYEFSVEYPDGSREIGELYTDGSGQLNGRWFVVPNVDSTVSGGGFSADTDQVPDASRITPMPVRPPMRAGHDVSLRVRIDTGGPAIDAVESPLHRVVTVDGARPGRMEIELANQAEIPNRDFELSWNVAGDGIGEGIFVHAGDGVDGDPGGYFSLVLDPPARVDDATVRPRELVFVLDTSGSMSGFPVEKAKAVMAKAIDRMRPADTFNMITFAGNTRILWTEPRPASPENRAEAQRFLAGQAGGGGTEMMKAIRAALVQTAAGSSALSPMELANLPADGRSVSVRAPYSAIEQDNSSSLGWRLRVGPELTLPARMSLTLPTILQPEGVELTLDGTWTTEQGQRLFSISDASFAGADAGPMRICMFLTDGYVGNDQAIIAAVRENARTTRVFSFGIGNSVNRYLLENMALAGRGECEIVLLNDDGDAAVDRFARRIQSPVLTDIQLAFSDGLQVTDVIPSMPAGAGGLIPDLYDVKPLVIHGRYTGAGRGTVTITGRTGAGRYERTLPLDLPAEEPEHAQIATLWARAQVDNVLAPHLAAVQEGSIDQAIRKQVVELGERHQILTPYTSFVAVEKARVTLGGKAILVSVPIELPEGTRWGGFFGGEGQPRPDSSRDLALGYGALETLEESLAAGAPAQPTTERFYFGVEFLQDGEDADQSLDSAGSTFGRRGYTRMPSGGVQLQESFKNVAGRESIQLGQPAANAPARGSRAALATIAPSSETLALAPTGKTRGRHRAAAVGATPMQPSPPPPPPPASAAPSAGFTGVTASPGAARHEELRRQLGTKAGVPTERAVTAGGRVAGGGGSGGGGGGAFGGGGGIRGLDGRSSATAIEDLRDGVTAVDADAGVPALEPAESWFEASADAPVNNRIMVMEAVQSVVHPDEWIEHGGSVLRADVVGDRVLFAAVEPGPDAEDMLLDAEAVRLMLEQAMSPTLDPALRGGQTGWLAGSGDPRLVRPQPDGAMLVLHDVRDLTVVDDEAALAGIVQEIVEPDGWRDNGGDESALVTLGSVWMIEGGPGVQQATTMLLGRLRLALGEPVATDVQAAIEAADAMVHPDDAPVTRVRLVSDLVAAAGPDGRDRLETVLLEMIDPDGWMANGGDDQHLMHFGDALVLRGPKANLDAVDTLLAQLRLVLELEQPDRGKVDGRAAQAWPAPGDDGGSGVVLLHTVDDLVTALGRSAPNAPEDARVATLTELVTSRTLADEWAYNGGDKGWILPYGTVLVVRATTPLQEETASTLALLRDQMELSAPDTVRAPTSVAIRNRVATAAEERAQREAALDRLGRLYRRLEPALFAAVVELEDPEGRLVDRDLLAADAGDRAVTVNDAPVAVTVLVADAGPAALAPLEESGLDIEAVATGSQVVVGTIPPRRLADLGTCAGVRRVERR